MTFRVGLPRLAHIWFPSYIRSWIERRSRSRPRVPIDLLVCLADHFEPGCGNPGRDTERRRVSRWVTEYPRVVEPFKDADGRPPQHTFFYPLEEYSAEHLDQLATLTRSGFAEVEVHLHHDNDTSDHLRNSLEQFRDALFHRHGLLSVDASGGVRYGFVHGNWALDNASPDGRWCGVNDEITILRETGCYADFTMPSAPEVGQTTTVNSIYYAIDDPQKPKSHDTGIRARVGATAPPTGLLMIQGPLCFDWHRRKWQILPGLENAAVDGSNPPNPFRFASWIRVGVAVAGREEWIFIKLHTHGGVDENADVFLGPAIARFHRAITEQFNDGTRFRLHYVTAREMANIAIAAAAGERGNAGDFRDYLLKRAS